MGFPESFLFCMVEKGPRGMFWTVVAQFGPPGTPPEKVSYAYLISTHHMQLDLNSPYFGPSMTNRHSQMDSCHSRPSLNILFVYLFIHLAPNKVYCDSLIFPHLRYLPNLRRLETGIYLLFPVCRNCSP